MANQLKGIARTEALLELGTPVDPSHQPVERYPGGSGGKVEHGELCLPVTSVFYHNLFFLVCFCQLLLSSAWKNKISPNHTEIPPKDTEISPKDKKISPKQNFLKWEILGRRIGISQ